MNKFFNILGGGLLLASATQIARADAITVFTARGSLQDGAAIGGTLTIDSTSGDVTGSDLTVGAPDIATFTRIAYQIIQTYAGGSVAVVSTQSALTGEELNFSFSPDLVHFTGGFVNGGNLFNPNTNAYGSSIASLDIFVPAAATVTPEPSSFVLLGSGVLGLAGAIRRRLR